MEQIMSSCEFEEIIISKDLEIENDVALIYSLVTTEIYLLGCYFELNRISVFIGCSKQVCFKP
jgi:hypothetical protein